MKSIQNVAIIMDGNGRWAQNRFRPRIWGHVRGAHVISNISERASDLGLNSLTLYAFSTENLSRPEAEVSFLFRLLDKFLIREEKKILENNIQFKVLGDFSFLNKKTLERISNLENKTKENTGLKLRFAFGYGGRSEILRACKKLNENQEEISEENFSKALYDDESDIDLLIRTGGDQRISNFLLWQIAYAELFFTKTPWPDFTTQEFSQIIQDTSKRERRFGQILTESIKEMSL